MVRGIIGVFTALAFFSPLAAQADSGVGGGTYAYSDFESHARAEKEWDVTLGIGGMVKPEYEGSDEADFMPLPIVDIRYRERAFLNPWRGLGYELIKTDNITAGPFVSYDFGRDDDEDDHIRGLGDVDGGLDLGLFGALEMGQFELELEVKQNAGGHDGLTAEADLMYKTYSGRNIFVNVGPTLTYASEDYMDSYFSVDAAQSAASGLSQFDADGGIKNLGMSMSVRYMINENWFAMGLANYEWLLGDAADSPVAEQEWDGNLALGIGYRF